MKISLSQFSFAMILIIYVAFAPIGLDVLYNPLIAGEYDSKWPIIYGLVRYFACLVFAGAALFSHGRSAYIRSLTPLVPFVLFCAASFVWSFDPKQTYKQLFYLICVAIWIAAIVQWIKIPQLLRYSAIINTTIVMASVLAAVFIPHIGRHHGSDLIEPGHAGNWRGIFIHKNILGEFAVTSFLLLLRNVRNERQAWQIFFWAGRISAVLCLVFCKSANALLGLACGLAVYSALSYKPTSKPLFLALVGVIGATLAFGLSLDPSTLAALLGRDSHFSGRTEIWALAQSMIAQHLWLGHGYASADSVFGKIATKLLFESATTIHSGYLDLVFDVGLAGSVILFSGVLYILGRAYATTFTTEGAERQATITYIAIVLSACAMASGEASPFHVVGDGVIGFWISLIALCQVSPLPKVVRRVRHPVTTSLSGPTPVPDRA